MKLVSLVFLICITLFSLGYAYNINNNPVAHEQWAQPEVDGLASLQSEDFQKLEKDSLGMVITGLAENYNLQKKRSNLRISELKNLINILLVVLFINVVGFIYWLYKTYFRKTI
jgi:hypothetical protein